MLWRVAAYFGPGLPRPTTRWGPGGRALTVMGAPRSCLGAGGAGAGTDWSRSARRSPLPGVGLSAAGRCRDGAGRTTPDTVPGRGAERGAPAPEVVATEPTDGELHGAPAPR